MNDFEYKVQDSTNIMNTYAKFDVVIEKGVDSTCYSPDGKKYIDFGAGIGVLSLGHCNKEWTNAVCEQAKLLAHCSNLYTSVPSTLLASKLTTLTGYDKVFFGNSGAEANEGAIKLARKYSFDKYGAGRDVIVTLKNSFHGRTITTLSATGQDNFHNYFFPFTEGFSYADANDLNDIISKITPNVCAVMVEFIQGEGGVLPLDINIISSLKKILDEKDILLIGDEVQTGVSRTGKFLCCEHYNIKPDIVTLAKGLGGGLPIGAFLCKEELSSVLSFGTHGSTFGGNPICCAAASTVVDIVSESSFLNNVSNNFNYIKDFLSSIKAVKQVRGMGLMIGFDIDGDVKATVGEMIEAGVLVLTAKNSIRLLPPLNISKEDLDLGLNIIKNVLTKGENN